MASIESTDATTDAVTKAKRTEQLHSAFKITCGKFLQHIKFSHMKKYFRMIYEENPECLRAIHDQLCSQMKKSIMEDLYDLSKEKGIDILLTSLENLQKNQDPSQHSWRPSGEPQEDLRDHIYPLKLQHKEELQTVLAKLQSDNEKLLNDISINHAEILHSKECNDDLYQAFSNITSSFTDSNLTNLQETLSNIIDAA